MKLSELVSADHNPRDITKKALNGLAISIERFGLVQPIVWNKKSGKIVGGHQRLKVLLEANEEEADVTVVDLDENEEVALNITLNNPSIQGYFDDGKLGELLSQLQNDSKELFDLLQMDELAKSLANAAKGAKELDLGQFDNFKHKCPRCGFEYDKERK